MSSLPGQHGKLIELIELQLENRISGEQFRQLEQMIREDAGTRQVYREYMDLHGVLHWDTARVDDQPLTPPEPPRPARQFPLEKIVAAIVTVAAVVVVAGLAAVFNHNAADDPAMAESDVTEVHDGPDGSVVDNNTGPNGNSPRPLPDRVVIVEGPESVGPESPPSRDPVGPPTDVDSTHVAAIPPPTGDLNSVVSYINAQIRRGWDENEVTPSPRSSDAEWLRRAYLDIVGHIPRPEETRDFLLVEASAQRTDFDRAEVIDRLLDDEDYIRNWSTIWTNLLIGRSNPRDVDRPALKKYLREAFARNRAWNEVVGEFIEASGQAEENGAANFLLAHVNNEAVPATAITARLFLGLQIQCTQCHDHPFNDWKQNHFWSFNSFFQQVDVRNAALVDSPGFDFTYYENRQGILASTIPQWEGTKFMPPPPGDSSGINLRSELATILTSGEKPQIARAFVNRLWKHFTGASFTPTVDEMGPHVAVSHPELLDGLSKDFVRSGYDVKRLIRAICRSDVYNLTSSATADNVEMDDPSIGLDPLFTRAYVKQMTVEQLFDSLLIATQADSVFGSDWTAASQRREAWLQQFVMAFETEENDEADLFNGTIPQALMMMNSDLVRRAVSDRDGYVSKVLRKRNTGESVKITDLSMAALSRRPSDSELSSVRRLIAENVSSRPPGIDATTARQNSMQDLFWAYLNSNEFILIH